MSDYDTIKDLEYKLGREINAGSQKVEMSNHLNNILTSLNAITVEKNVNDIKKNIGLLLKQIENNNEIDLEKVKTTSDEIYNLNLTNQFSKETDYISNEYYAFQYILQELLKKGGK